MFTGRDLDDSCHAGTGSGGQPDPGQLHPENRHGLTFDSNSFKIDPVTPRLQLADQFDADFFGDPLLSEQFRNL